MSFNFFRQLQKRDRNFQIEIDGQLLPVEVRENDRAKRLTLRIIPGAKGLKVTMPSHVGDDEVEEFVIRNRNWIAARLSRQPDAVVLEPGAMVPFKGVDHRIVLSGKLRGLVEVCEENGEMVLKVPGEAQTVSRKLVAFFKKQARSELDRVVTIHCDRLGVRAKQIRITDTTSRWGSCSSTRTLSFSWRIIMAPPEVLNYLAAHEVAHLREMNHSNRFWKLTKELCPDMEQHKSWLRVHGAKLHAVVV